MIFKTGNNKPWKGDILVGIQVIEVVKPGRSVCSDQSIFYLLKSVFVVYFISVLHYGWVYWRLDNTVIITILIILAYVHIQYMSNILSWNSVQAFLAKTWLSLILIFFHTMSLSSGGHYGIFWHIASTFWEPFNMFPCSFVQMLLVFLSRVTVLFFLYHDSVGEP